MPDMNIHTKKKTCKRCFASKHNKCELGYDLTLYSDEPTGIRAFGIPKEPCPKPTTISDFIYATKFYNKLSTGFNHVQIHK